LQSLTRYFAKTCGLYPSDSFEALVVDEAMDVLAAVISKISEEGKDIDETKKIREEHQVNFVTAAAKLLENRIQTYGGGKGFVSSVSVADLYLMGVVQLFELAAVEFIDPKFFDAYPGIQ
jgi:hypothetical protein